MYNSVFVSLFMKIVRAFQNWYSNSLTHKLISSIKNVFSRAFNNSFFKRIFENLENAFNNAYINKIGDKLFDLVDWILNKLNNFTDNQLLKSETIKGFDEFSDSYKSGFRFIYITLISMALVFFIFYLLGNLIINLWFLLVIFLIGLVGLGLNGREVSIIKGSKIIDFFLDIFRPDKGGDQWW